jgi:lantibiotic biosynthesis protein
VAHPPECNRPYPCQTLIFIENLTNNRMNNYQFTSSLLVRTPLLSSESLPFSPNSILRREDFRVALFLASRSLFLELAKKDFDYDLLTAKQKQTVKKYLNRASFRSTPFGLFSSVCLIPWSDNQDEMALSEPSSYLTLDFAVTHEIWERLQQSSFKTDTVFRTNPSMYFSKIDFRYITRSITSDQAQFSVVSAEKNSILKSLLQFCRRPRTNTEIISFLECLQIDRQHANGFVMDLVREQILNSETAPNVTGSDLLQTMATHLPLAKGYLTELSGIDLVNPKVTEQLCSLSEKIQQDLCRADKGNYFYSISKRSLLKGGLQTRYQESLKEGLQCLQLLASPNISNDLESFKKAFARKYEGQTLPLLEVMDAQFGIGYGGLDRPKVTYGFSSVGYRSSQPHEQAFIENEPLALVLKQWHNQSHGDSEIHITDEDLEGLKRPDPASQPPSISVLFRTLDDKIVIESAGGPSALPLVGRFSVFNEIYQHGKSIAQREQQLNKDIIFAEIAHLCNLHTANINRRAHFYDYEIPVLTHSTVCENRQIQLSDLLVTVKDNSVVLLSRKLKKIVIPRLSSAFNYTKNDLPIFRFLCDLQNQGLKTHLSFSLSKLVPGLSYYPRVVYKSCILQLAEWHLFAPALQVDGHHECALSTFREKAKLIRLSRYFSYTVGDNFLVFDCENDQDLLLFLEEIKGRKNIVLKEFPFIGQEGARTETGASLLTQFLASLVLEKEVYPLSGMRRPAHVIKQSDTKDWIYFKVYCHPLSSDMVLTKYLFPLVEELKKQKLITRWFWIRYNDPEYHLRFRVKIDANTRVAVLKSLTVALSKACTSQLVSHFQSDIYKRELERYSPDLIDQVEHIFETSSELVALWLQDQRDTSYEDRTMMIRSIQSSSVTLDAFELSAEEKTGFCRDAFDRFFTEFGSPKTLKTEMEKLNREVGNSLYTGGGSEEVFESLRYSIKELIRTQASRITSPPPLKKLAGDLIHMHLNRLFIYEQRYFEMVHYFLLYRVLSKRMHKKID